jgi:hypothetical protein
VSKRRAVVRHVCDGWTSGPGPARPQPETTWEQDSIDKGILITAEGVHPSEKGALVRKARGAAITATDGPFTEAKEVIGGFGLINAKDRAEAVEYAQQYADLFEEVEVEVRQVVEFDELPDPA